MEKLKPEIIIKMAHSVLTATGTAVGRYRVSDPKRRDRAVRRWRQSERFAIKNLLEKINGSWLGAAVVPLVINYSFPLGCIRFEIKAVDKQFLQQFFSDKRQARKLDKIKLFDYYQLYL